STGTVKLKSIFPNEDGVLFPSQFVNARLLVDTHRGVTLVPNPAIQRSSQGSFVYQLTDQQTVKMQPVTVGVTDGASSEVSGLDAGVLVATDNFNRLSDGAKVN